MVRSQARPPSTDILRYIMKKELLIILLLLLLSIPAVKSLFIPGGFTSHDLTHHVVRQISMEKLLSEGQFPPRWSGQLNNGFGYPVFLFNYPLPAIAGEVFYKLGFNFVTAVKAVLFSSMILSLIGMYLFLKSYLKTTLPAFLGAIFYLYAPHRFLNVYVSASVGSALAQALVPFVFWGLVKIKEGINVKGQGERWVLIGALFFASLILAHNVTTLIFSPLLLSFAGILIWESKDRRKLFKYSTFMFLLGLGLSAWFWLPSLLEKQYIIFDQVFKDFYKDQFITFWQLIRSPWGYGLSHPQNPQLGDMSYQLGLIHIGAFSVFSFWYFLKGYKKIKTLGLFLIISFLLSIFLMLKVSQPVWDNLPFLSLIQFPLRFSALAVFVSSIAAALLIKYLPYKKVMFICLLILVIYANRNHWKINEVFDSGEDYYKSIKPTTATYSEHLPKWGRAMDEKSLAKLEFLEGGGKIKFIEDKSNKVLAEIEVETFSKVRFNQFYFPGWEIKVNGQKINPDYQTEGESYGLQVFEIQTGKHQILAEFKNTPIRNVADAVSFLSVIIWGGILCRLLIRK